MWYIGNSALFQQVFFCTIVNSTNSRGIPVSFSLLMQKEESFNSSTLHFSFYKYRGFLFLLSQSIPSFMCGCFNFWCVCFSSRTKRFQCLQVCSLWPSWGGSCLPCTTSLWEQRCYQKNRKREVTFVVGVKEKNDS